MESMNKNEFRMSKKDHFKVLITMAFQNLVSWKELKQLLEDMTSTLIDSNQVVKLVSFMDFSRSNGAIESKVGSRVVVMA